MTASPLLEVSGLKMHFDAGRKKAVKAVDGVSFHIKRGKHSDLSENRDAVNRRSEGLFSVCMTRRPVRYHMKGRIYTVPRQNSGRSSSASRR